MPPTPNASALPRDDRQRVIAAGVFTGAALFVGVIVFLAALAAVGYFCGELIGYGATR